MNYKRISKPIMLINITLSVKSIKKSAESEPLPWRLEDMKEFKKPD